MDLLGKLTQAFWGECSPMVITKKKMLEHACIQDIITQLTRGPHYEFSHTSRFIDYHRFIIQVLPLPLLS